MIESKYLELAVCQLWETAIIFHNVFVNKRFIILVYNLSSLGC